MSVSSGTKILFETIKNGSKEDILRILEEEKDIDLHRIDKHGKTVLTMPFRNEKFTENDVIDVLEYFLDRGVNPDIGNDVGETALLEAAASSNKGAVDLLIKRQANVNKICKKSNGSVTHHLVQYWVWKDDFSTMSDAELVAMEKESASYVEWLITKGFDFERQNRFGVTALSQLLDFGLQHVALVILQHTQQVSDTCYGKNNLLHHFFNVHGFLHKRYHESEKRRNYYSRYASKIVKILLDKGVSALDLGNVQTTPLCMAVANGDALEVIDQLLDHLVWSNHHQRSDVATTVLFELCKASKWWGDESRTDYLLKVVRTLITEGADVNAKDIKENTALCYAFQGQNRRAADVLGENGADFGRLYDDGRNLFHVLAASRQSSDKAQEEALFDFLADKACCDVNARDHCARTPLHYAAQSRNSTIARKLIQHGANVNAKDSDGSTALHLSVGLRGGSEGQFLELLLTSGAEVNCKNLNGKRPFACVTSFTSRSNLSLLLKWGALVNDYQDGDSIFSTDFDSKDVEFAMEMLAYGLDMNDSRICRFFESPFVDHSKLLTDFLSKHWIKHEVAKFPCSDYYKDFLWNYEAGPLYHESCLKEVSKLKSSLIDSQTSLYDYLHMDFESRVIHNNNEKLRNFVDQPDSLQQQFAQYSVFILASYRAAVRWKSLLEPAKKAWLRLTHIALPDVCIEIIFAHLRIEDLVDLIEDV